MTASAVTELFNPAPEPDPSAAFEEADRLLRASGTSAWTDWRVTFALARWLVGEPLELRPTNRKERTMAEEGIDLTVTLDDEKPELGVRYLDPATGFEGVATGVFLYLAGSTRVGLEARDPNGKLVEATFDAGRLRKAT